MSRSGYDDGCDGWDLIRWRGAVNSAIKGKRGQAFLRELAEAMDAMPQKRLIEGELIAQDGEVCALGVVCKARGLNTENIDPEASERISKMLGVSNALVCEIENENDEGYYRETPEQRWGRLRGWVSRHLEAPSDPGGNENQPAAQDSPKSSAAPSSTKGGPRIYEKRGTI